jgi:hypothetical protein
MAVRDEVKAERDKMKGRPLKDRLEYFWEYYKIHTIVGVVLLVIAFSIGHSILSNREDALNAVFVNADALDDGAAEELTEQVARRSNIKTDEKDVNIDLFRTLSLGGPVNQTDFGTAGRFQAQMQDHALDVMVLDPPREGIHPKVLPKLLSYGVERFVYVSCKPQSLARDIVPIAEAGYQPEKAVCVDMFPWTKHIETVVLFCKDK